MKKSLIAYLLATLIVLSGCSSNLSTKQPKTEHAQMDHMDMNHAGSGKLPSGLKAAANPTFKVGSQAMIQSDHMPGMNGVAATIVGAYDTTVYAVSYTPTNGGAMVKNHRWVIQEEMPAANGKVLPVGAKVVIEADHMPGMKGVLATVDSAEKTTVYMVDYIPSTGGEMVKNHQWVTESELSKK